MAKPDGPASVTWGTLEELLLACAVNRYGTSCWESVAKEIQKRTSSFYFFTSESCKQKYYDLKRRFASQTDLTGDAASSDSGAAVEEGAGDTSAWLDELRRLRIAELKRELEHYDLSIVSLQLKVKRLSEECEKSLIENEKEPSDLQRTEQGERVDDQKEEEENKPEAPSPPLPETGADDGAPPEESDRENQSVNASNSSDPKGEKSEEHGGKEAGEKEPVEPATDPPADPEQDTANPASEDSYNGSSDTIASAKEPAASQDLGSAKADPVCDSPESVESVAESTGGEEEDRQAKETSEFQSSASLSRKKGRRTAVYFNSSTEEPENQSAAGKSSSVKFQPLAEFLDVIRRHKLGSLFERRLDSQGTSNYKNLIRQHVDLETIRTMLEAGQYAKSPSKFYRDLLLLATNATVFFPKRAPEHNAALELRQLVSTKLTDHPSMPTNPPVPPPTLQPQPKPGPDSPPVMKPKLLGPAITCRKRSSIVLKPSGGEKKAVGPTETTNDGKEKGKDKSASEGKDQLEKPSWFSTVTKKRTRDQSLASRSLGANTTSNKSSSNGPSSKGGPGNEDVGAKQKKDNTSNAAASGGGKKKSAANFLSRIRKSSIGLLDSTKSSVSANSESNGKGGETKKNNSGTGGKSSKKKGPTKDEGNASRKGSLPASAKEKGKQKDGSHGEGSKRNVGRPSKRTAAVASTAKRKRGSDGDKAEGAATKKRSRR